MTKTYVVSGIGCEATGSQFWVPSNVGIHFYRKVERPPQARSPRNVLEERLVADRLFPTSYAGPGESVREAYCWNRGGHALETASGVFRRSTGGLVLDLENTSPDSPVSLSYIVTLLAARRPTRQTVLHWVVLPDPAVTELPISAKPKYPPRLSYEDSAESRRAELDALVGEPEDLPPMPLRSATRWGEIRLG